MQRAVAEPVAVIGAGAIGMMLGAALARAGHPITVAGGRPINSFQISQGETTEHFGVTAADSPADLVDHRLVILAVKAQNTPQVAHWLRAAAHRDTTVLVAQNGLEHAERVAGHVGDSAVVPAVVYVPVDRPEPGRAIVHRPVDRDLTVPADPAALAIAERLRLGGLRVETAADFRTAAWRKVLTNLGSNPITALTGRRTEVVREPGIADYALVLVREAAAVAAADGAHLSADTPEATIAWLQALPDGASTSMLQDRLAGRPLEHDALTGAVLRAAARHDVPVPHLQAIHAMLEATTSR